jgi:predicted metal-binding membrane protein
MSQVMSNIWMLFIEIPLWHVKGFVWAVMMLPSAIPMLLAFAKVCRLQNKTSNRLTGIFMSAYLSIWLVFSSHLTLLKWKMQLLA